MCVHVCIFIYLVCKSVCMYISMSISIYRDIYTHIRTQDIIFYSTIYITYVREGGGGKAASDCVALTYSPESAQTLQFAAKHCIFSHLVNIKIYIALWVTWRVSEPTPPPLLSSAGQKERPGLELTCSSWDFWWLAIIVQTIYWTNLFLKASCVSLCFWDSWTGPIPIWCNSNGCSGLAPGKDLSFLM